MLRHHGSVLDRSARMGPMPPKLLFYTLVRQYEPQKRQQTLHLNCHNHSIRTQLGLQKLVGTSHTTRVLRVRAAIGAEV